MATATPIAGSDNKLSQYVTVYFVFTIALFAPVLMSSIAK